MELLVLIDQGVGWINRFLVRDGYNRRVNYTNSGGVGFPRSGSVPTVYPNLNVQKHLGLNIHSAPTGAKGYILPPKFRLVFKCGITRDVIQSWWVGFILCVRTVIKPSCVDNGYTPM